MCTLVPAARALFFFADWASISSSLLGGRLPRRVWNLDVVKVVLADGVEGVEVCDEGTRSAPRGQRIEERRARRAYRCRWTRP